jgi:hypothetical protein
MKLFFQKLIFKRFLISLIGLAFFLPSISLAATVGFDSPTSPVGTGSEFLIGLTLTAPQPVNALSISVKIPEGLDFIDTSDGNSVINFWIDKPAYDSKTRILSFSGIIPGGYSGKNGRLLLVHAKSTEDRTYTLSYDLNQSKVYLNTPNALLDILSAQSLLINSKSGIKNIQEQDDISPPESFAIDIVQNKNEFENKWVAVFSTQDKGSGISHYEIAENYKKITDYDSLEWKITDSPYILKDQTRRSFVYVKAVDKKGNMLVEIHDPLLSAPWYLVYLRYIIIAILFILVLCVIFGVKKYKRSQ